MWGFPTPIFPYFPGLVGSHLHNPKCLKSAIHSIMHFLINQSKHFVFLKMANNSTSYINKLKKVEYKMMMNMGKITNSNKPSNSEYYSILILLKDLEKSLQPIYLTRTYNKPSHTTWTLNIKIWVICLI